MGGAVLHIGAHPDDEDGGLMAYMSRKYGIRTVYWSATRGEGGQNRIGPYQGEALGIYRTWESLDARAIDGGETLFGPFYDFGFCKSGEEALAKWGREQLVGEIVRAIRIVQPQIVVSRWSGTAKDGHGHHQAVGQVTLEAFEMASDPAQFTGQLSHGIAVWQPSKLYYSTGGDWQPGEDAEFGHEQPELDAKGLLRINTGEFDPISGRTYQELAWLAINRYQTQAMGFVPNQDDFYYYYRLDKSHAAIPASEESFYDGLDPTIVGLADYPGAGSESLRTSLENIKQSAIRAFELFRVENPLQAGEALMEGLLLLRELRARLEEEGTQAEASQGMHEYLARKVHNFESVASQCLGLQLECLADRARMTPGQRFRLASQVWNQSDLEIKQISFKLRLSEGWEAYDVPENGGNEEELGLSIGYEVVVANAAELACPYWLAERRDPYIYRWPDNKHVSSPFGPSLIGMESEVDIGENRLTLRASAIHRESFSGGYRELHVAILPPISLHPRKDKEFMQAGIVEQSLDLQVVARSNEELGEVAGVLTLDTPPGWSVEPEHIDLSLENNQDIAALRFRVTVPGGVSAGDYQLRYVVQSSGRDYDFVLNPVRMGAPGMPRLPDASTSIREEFVVEPAEITVHIIDAKFVPGLKYAYMKGMDEELLETLRPLGLDFKQINDDELGYTDLSLYDAIIVGPNAYLIRDELANNASRLLDYVEQGGTLIVQYQGYGYQGRGFTPYPFEYSQPHDRVTDETAPVRILKPDLFLLNQPNSITETDFDGWVHDRGLYFFGEWDRRYESVISSSDPDEPARDGGMLITNYGRGTYLYTGYSFYRQLPSGVKGAFQLFANMLAIPAARVLERIKFLKDVALFSFMSEEQLQGVARIMTERWENDGSYLCHQGDEGNELYIIVEGQVEIIDESSGEDQVILTEQPGACIGELAALEIIPRVAAMRAKGETRLLVLQGSDFRSLIHENPDMSQRVIQLLVRKLAVTPRSDASAADAPLSEHPIAKMKANWEDEG